MSRIRSIHPGFFTDENLVSTSAFARLLFFGLAVEADDKGVFEWKPITLKMRIFPADNIDVSALLDELLGVDAICQYEIDCRKYGAIRNFRKFQKPKTPNDIHPMPDHLRKYVALEGLNSAENGDNKDEFPQNGENGLGQVVAFPPKGENHFQMEDGGDKVEDGVKLFSDENKEIQVCESQAMPPIGAAISIWNEAAQKYGWPVMTKTTDARRKALSARLRADGLEGWRNALTKAGQSPFLTDPPQGFFTVDWLVKPSNFLKVIEGNYDDRRSGNIGSRGHRDDAPHSPLLRAIAQTIGESDCDDSGL